MSYPKLLEVQLTGACNLGCLYCGNSEEFLHDSSADFDNVMAAILELSPERILFTGGEVYLEWKLLIKILETLKKTGKNYKFTLSSNLTMISTRELDLLIDYYCFDTFHSSFNDLDDEMSMKIRRNTKQGRENLIRNITHLCERQVDMKIETMLITGTIERLKEINSLLFSLGVRKHRLEFLIPVGQTRKEIIIDYEYALDKILELYKAKENTSCIIPSCIPIAPCNYSHELFNIRAVDLEFNKCVDGLESCYLMSNGKLLPCFIFPDDQIEDSNNSYSECWW